jgi:hypothetical protein
VRCAVQNEVHRLKADAAAKDARIASLQGVSADNAVLRDKIARLRNVLLTARETLAELPRLQEALAAANDDKKRAEEQLHQQVAKHACVVVDDAM